MTNRKHPTTSGFFARSVPSVAVAALLATLTHGCMRPLAVQDELLAPGSDSIAKSRGETLHTVRHHLALQAVQHACASSSAPGGDPGPGPDMGRAAARGALAEICASAVVPTAPVGAYGSLSNAHRRWAEDRVRELPEPSETAAAAAGGG